MFKYRHECPEWDYMLIDESFLCEISCCTCFHDNEFIEFKSIVIEEIYKLQLYQEVS